MDDKTTENQTFFEELEQGGVWGSKVLCTID